MATFRRHEHLKSARIIGELMTKGRSCNAYPVKLIWMPATLTSKVPAQVAFSVPKKYFPRAVDRNRMKRLLRECYRGQKNKVYDFLNASGKQYALMVVFTSKKSLSLNEVMEKFALTLQQLEKEIKRDTKQPADTAD